MRSLHRRSHGEVRRAARQYFSEAELDKGRIRDNALTLFDARFELHDGTLRVTEVPDDPWLRDRVVQLPPDEAIWEVAAWVKVRRLSSPGDIVDRARSGELYDESYFTQRGGGAPYVGYPLELNGYGGNFVAIARSLIDRYHPARVLDIGCATGLLVKELADAGVAARGIDFSHWAVDHAVTDAVVQGSALALPWGDDSFDVVISQDFMEHMHPDDLPAVIAEQARVLAPGGHILHLIPFYDTDPPVQLDAHLCQATQDWWMRFLAAQPGIEIVREPGEDAPDLIDCYVDLTGI